MPRETRLRCPDCTVTWVVGSDASERERECFCCGKEGEVDTEPRRHQRDASVVTESYRDRPHFIPPPARLTRRSGSAWA